MKKLKTCGAALAVLLAAPAAPVIAASIASQAEALMPTARQIENPYQRGLAEGWLDIAQRQDDQVLVSSPYNDAAAKALANARHYIDGSTALTPIYGARQWPTRDEWIKAIRQIEAVNDRASKSACKGEAAGRLSALTDEVWKEQDETHGTRWVHGWSSIERARKLAEDVDAELARCAGSATATATAMTTPSSEPPPDAPLTLSADALFGFDSAVLTPEGKQTLVTLAQAWRKTMLQVVLVTGYADRLGASEHNLNLSRRRAEAVANTLKADGVMAQRFIVQGKGTSSPVVNCTGGASPTVIACLAPNRRVEIRGLNGPVRIGAGGS
jgi:OOP family OmpA-OmpF porin